MVRYRRTLCPAQGANGKRIRIDDGESVVGARPDLSARVLEELVDTLAGKTLGRAEPDEVRLAVVAAAIQHTDAAAERADPETAAPVGQQRGHVPGPESRGFRGVGKNALHLMRGEIETVEAVLGPDPQRPRRPPVDDRDPLVREPLDVGARDSGLRAQIQGPQAIEPANPQHIVLEVQRPDGGAGIMLRRRQAHYAVSEFVRAIQTLFRTDINVAGGPAHEHIHVVLGQGGLRIFWIGTQGRHAQPHRIEYVDTGTPQTQPDAPVGHRKHRVHVRIRQRALAARATEHGIDSGLSGVVTADAAGGRNPDQPRAVGMQRLHTVVGEAGHHCRIMKNPARLECLRVDGNDAVTVGAEPDFAGAHLGNGTNSFHR